MYVRGNPVKYIDPTGHSPGLVVSFVAVTLGLIDYYSDELQKNFFYSTDLVYIYQKDNGPGGGSQCRSRINFCLSIYYLNQSKSKGWFCRDVLPKRLWLDVEIIVELICTVGVNTVSPLNLGIMLFLYVNWFPLYL